MTLKEIGRIQLPPHRAEGGFDHAAVHLGSGRLFVAHTANDSVDVVDLSTRKFSGSIPDLKGVAGVWLAEEPGLLFTTNRGEDTACVFDLPTQVERYRVPTGHRPNGMAYDPARGQLLVAGVGNPKEGVPATATLIDVTRGKEFARFSLPGRSRWSVYNRHSDSFFVNIADPPGIVQVEAAHPTSVGRFIELPGIGPHGLEQGRSGRTLYSLCDDGQAFEVELASGGARMAGRLSGAPDVAWVNPNRDRLYVAVGEPGVVDVFQMSPFAPLETVRSGDGAHTLTFDRSRNEVHVFLPRTHEDLLLRET